MDKSDRLRSFSIIFFFKSNRRALKKTHIRPPVISFLHKNYIIVLIFFNRKTDKVPWFFKFLQKLRESINFMCKTMIYQYKLKAAEVFYQRGCVIY